MDAAAAAALPGSAASSAAVNSGGLTGLPVNLLEAIVDRVDRGNRHSLRSTCRAARGAVNGLARTLALDAHPAVCDLRRAGQAVTPALAAAVRAVYPGATTLILGLENPPSLLFTGNGTSSALLPNGTSDQAPDSKQSAVKTPRGRYSNPDDALMETVETMSLDGGGGPSSSDDSSWTCGANAGSLLGSWAGTSDDAPGDEDGGSGSSSRRASFAGFETGFFSFQSHASIEAAASDSAGGCCGGALWGCGCDVTTISGGRNGSASGRGSGSGSVSGSGSGAVELGTSAPAALAVVKPLPAADWARPGIWAGLRRLVFSFDALTDATARRLAAAAPLLSEIGLLSADHPPGALGPVCAAAVAAVGGSPPPPSAAVRNQARRLAALRHLPRLARLDCDAPLWPDALRALRAAAGGRLVALRLDAPGPPRQHCPGGCLEELSGMAALEELSVAYIAGRTLTHAGPLRLLTNLQKLSVWVGSFHASPPWSSRPLPDLIPSAAALPRLTELRLLQGLRRAADLQQLAALTWAPALRDLGLHDSVLGADDLIVLARCRALEALSVDTIQLGAAPVQLPALRRLRVNVLGPGRWRAGDVFPGLEALGQLKETLGPRGFGVSMPLSFVEGSPRLSALSLMLGALQSKAPCTTNAVIGAPRAAGGDAGVTDVTRVLCTLPALSRLTLLGFAGGYGRAPGSSAALAAAAAATLESGPLARIELVAWPRGEAEAAAPAVKAAAPRIQVVIKREWVG